MLAVLAIICANTSAYAADSGSASTVNRKMYGYFNYNGALAGAYGFCSLNLNDLSKADVIYPYGNMKSIYSGAAVDDVFYAYEYVYDSFMGPQNSDFISYNITTGRYTVLGSEGLAAQGTNFKTQDMTYDYSSKTMYAIGFYQGESALYSVNLKDGMLTKVTTLQKTLGVIAADMDGTLYGVGANDGVLYKVNKMMVRSQEYCRQVSEDCHRIRQWNSTILLVFCIGQHAHMIMTRAYKHTCCAST